LSGLVVVAAVEAAEVVMTLAVTFYIYTSTKLKRHNIFF
jgi:hypothetical protein